MLIIIHIISLIRNYTKSDEQKYCQWWSNNLELSLSFLAILIGIACLILKKPHLSILITSIIFLISLIAGLIQSFIKRPFDI